MNTKPKLLSRAYRYNLVLSTVLYSEGIKVELAKATPGPRHLSLSYKLADPTRLKAALALAEPLALAANVPAVLAKRQTGFVNFQIELPQGYWQFYTRQDVTGLGVGLGESFKQVDFSFDIPHSLVAGTTGSGKTETIKTIITAISLNNQPDSLALVICDRHGDFVCFDNLAHLAMPIARSQDEIERAINYVYREFQYRMSEGIRDAKNLCLVIDEAGEVLTNRKTLALIQSIAGGGRKFNVNLILGDQKPSEKTLPNILDKTLNRFIGQVADASLSAKLTGHAEMFAHKLAGQGDFLHVRAGDAIRFQVAQATEQDYYKLPRAEIVIPAAAEVGNIIEFPADLEPPGRGRPRLELDPKLLAWYFCQNPEKVSHAMARLANISRDNHMLHRDFCRQFVIELKRLMNQKRLEA